MNIQEIFNNTEPKLIYEKILKEKLSELDLNGDGVTDKALKDGDGNIISDTYVKINDLPTGSTVEVVNDLTTGGTTKALSAEQGKILQNGKMPK